jgi:hypothetical protein
MPIAGCGLKRKTKKIRNPKSEIAEPMLFPRNALASGPQACFYAEKATAKVGKAFTLIDKNPADELIRGRSIGILPIL